MTDEESHYHQLKEIDAMSTNLNLTVRCRDTLSSMSEGLSDIACQGFISSAIIFSYELNTYTGTISLEPKTT